MSKNVYKIHYDRVIVVLKVMVLQSLLSIAYGKSNILLLTASLSQ